MRRLRLPGSDNEHGDGAGISRRSLLGASASGAAALLLAGCGLGGDDEGSGGENGSGNGGGSGGGSGDDESAHPPAPPSGALGANFNEDPSDMTFAQLRGISAGWLRGFIPMRETETSDPARQKCVATLLKAREEGYGTILSLKFPYQHKALPEAGSSAMDAELARVDKVLAAALGKMDILVIGNEPFLETRQAERRGPAINAFYEHLAEHVIAYRKKHFGARCRTRLYMGALNRLDDPSRRTGPTRRWMEFVGETREIEGVDIHPHVTSLDAGQKYLDYVLPHLRDDQKFLATEFSLVLNWGRHMRDKIPAAFASKYDVAPDTRVWQLLKEAAENPFPQEKWDAFLAASPWFHRNRRYLRDQMRKFRDTGKLAVATYGVVQADAMVRNIGPDKTPWMLNSVYASRTVEEGEDGSPGLNKAWYEDFRALQRQRDRLPVRTGETAT
ncbi:hypothetical protein ACWGJ2_14820 [Streptomyces sp. NPDC054796]